MGLRGVLQERMNGEDDEEGEVNFSVPRKMLLPRAAIEAEGRQEASSVASPLAG